MGARSAPDRNVARLAQRQGGIVSHSQLVRLGVTRRAIARRIERGRLHPIHRGVYAVGHTILGVDGRRWAALLAVSGDVCISHHTAADAIGIRRSDSPLVHVTVRGRGGRERHVGIRIHRPRALPEDELTVLRGMPITTPSRTLLDLAYARLPGDSLAKALDQAHRLKLIDFAELRSLLARYPRRPGTHSLNAQLSRYRGYVDTRSELERLVYKLCNDHGLPAPLVNCVIEGKVRDFYWPARRLVVEADSYSFHSSSALNDDRERDVQLTLAGYTILRFTWEQVTKRPNYVVSALLQVLGAD